MTEVLLALSDSCDISALLKDFSDNFLCGVFWQASDEHGLTPWGSLSCGRGRKIWHHNETQEFCLLLTDSLPRLPGKKLGLQSLLQAVAQPIFIPTYIPPPAPAPHLTPRQSPFPDPLSSPSQPLFLIFISTQSGYACPRKRERMLA